MESTITIVDTSKIKDIEECSEEEIREIRDYLLSILDIRN